jgi:hypothetical protein
MSYLRFGLMIAVSTALMYAMTYLNVYQASHVRWSETRLFMALIMGSMMGVVMLGFMWRMYSNLAILAFCAVLFAGSLYLVRSQATVGDVAWMKAMIPHHSIAILTSERATLTNPKVKDLAGRIIEAQRREIGEMEGLIREIEDAPGGS